jgi:NADPH-dependent 2,4-dienoyl-CoA reductase/sulfur reductase-like enzyme
VSEIVIVGASLAGLRTAEALRDSGFDGSLTLVGDEESAPYDRPPLSKQFLRGEWNEERILLRPPAELHDRLNLDVRLGTTATRVDPAGRTLGFSDGQTLNFDKLVIATGARARTLAASAAHRSAHVVRTKADSIRLRDALKPGQQVVVVGAGFIGAEVAATAKSLGCDVTIVEAAAVPLERQLGAQMGAACGALHERNGVTLRCGATVGRFESEGVELTDGTVLPADHVVVGVGAQPNTDWLEGSGLGVSDGLMVDSRCRALTDDGRTLDHIVGVGDVARFPNLRYRSLDGPGALSMRIEHWTNAAEMAMAAAQTLVGEAQDYQPVPYFWSDQYTHKIQFFGRADGFDEVLVVDGNPDDGSWLALYRRGDQLVAALGVSKIRALIPYRQLLLKNASWDEPRPNLRDPQCLSIRLPLDWTHHGTDLRPPRPSPSNRKRRWRGGSRSRSSRARPGRTNGEVPR